EGGLPRREVLGMNVRGPAVAQFVVERAAGEREPRASQIDVAPIGGRHPERNRRLVGQDPKARLALLERCTCAALLGRVAKDEDDPAGRTAASLDRADLRLD